MLKPGDLYSPLMTKVLNSGPDSLAKLLKPIKRITPARIRKYKKHVHKLIENSRAEYFHKAGIPPVPHPMSKEEVEAQLVEAVRMWITLHDKYGKNVADNQIKQLSKLFAHEDANSPVR